MRTSIILTKYLKKGSVMFLGRNYGEKIRKKIKLDKYDLDENKYTFVFPENLELISNSFFLGLLGKSFLSLGLKKTNEKYVFDIENLKYRENIQIDIDDGISYATVNLNSIK